MINTSLLNLASKTFPHRAMVWLMNIIEHEHYPSVVTAALHIAPHILPYTSQMHLFWVSKIVLNTLIKESTVLSSRHLHASTGMSSRPLIVFPLIILFIAACCQSQLPVFMLVLVCMYLLTCSALLMYYKPTEKKTLEVFLSWISSLCCGTFSGTSISIFPILCTFPHLHSGSFSHLHPRVWVLIIDAILYILLHFLSFLNVKPATKRQEMHRKTWQCWTGLSQWSRSALTQHAVTFLDSYKSGYSVDYKADFLLKHKYPVTLYLPIHWLSSIRPLAFFFPSAPSTLEAVTVILGLDQSSVEILLMSSMLAVVKNLRQLALLTQPMC